MSFDVVKHKAPAYWASYLINGDASGLDDAEARECDAWIARIGLGAPVDVEECGFGILYVDWARSHQWCGEVAEFSFLEARPC